MCLVRAGARATISASTPTPKAPLAPPPEKTRASFSLTGVSAPEPWIVRSNSGIQIGAPGVLGAAQPEDPRGHENRAVHEPRPQFAMDLFFGPSALRGEPRGQVTQSEVAHQDDGPAVDQALDRP